MSMRGIFVWGMIGALGVTGMVILQGPKSPVISLEGSLGPKIEISRL
ncbi:MAG: hypothetical protein AAFY31_06465 [Pseudomonadota bacterium]